MNRYLFVKFVIAVLVGLLSFYQLSVAISSIYILFLPIAVMFLIIIQRLQRHIGLNISIWLFGWIFGFVLAWVSFSMQPNIAESEFNKSVMIVGKIVGLPQVSKSIYGTNKIQFIFAIKQINGIKTTNFSYIKPLVKIGWYEGSNEFLPAIKTGQSWCLPVRLKPNHASFNPSAFDYEQYLFVQQIVAKGFVNNRNALAKKLHQSGFDLRFWLSKKITNIFKSSELFGLYKALLIGDKSNINAQQWQVLQKTGTSHLMAISGLHIGIMAMLGFVIFGLLWKVLIRNFLWAKKTPKIIFSAVGVLCLISLYLYISGAAVSTQRAWIMAVVLILLLVLRRKFQAWAAISLAALVVVIWQPNSVLSAGFWLSFGAVTLIFITLENYRIKNLANWQKTIIIQVVLTVGMIPVLAFYFQQVPIVSSIANLIAVPVVALLALPILFLSLLTGLIFIDLYPPIVSLVTNFNNFVWQNLWQYLNILTSIESNFWLLGRVDIWQVIAVYLVWFLAYKLKINFAWKFIIFIASFIVFIVLTSQLMVDKPKQIGQVKVTVLDVGQGQATVFETKNKVVIYDTGAKWGDKLDGAKLAILPYLRQQQIKKVDVLMVSHSDLDHAGGVNSLLQSIVVENKVTGQVSKLNRIVGSKTFTNCHQQQWKFDQVIFKVISNPHKKASDNDESCVLQVLTEQQSLIVSGDATIKIEKNLVNKYAKNLKSSILIAGHHGSNTSTSKEWLKAIQPEMVVFSAGYGNRFGFPRQEVIKRITENKIRWLNTACSGAIGFTITKDSWRLDYQSRLRQQKLFHHRCIGL